MNSFLSILLAIPLRGMTQTGLPTPLADPPDWIMDPLERGLFAVIQWCAILCWNLDRGLLVAAVQIYDWRNALTNPQGVIVALVTTLTDDPALRNLLGGALQLALLLAAILFGLRFIAGRHWEVVDLPRLAGWLCLVGLLLAQGPQIVADLERARAGLSNAAYQVAAAVNQGMNYQNPEMPDGPPGSLGPLTHLFPATTQLAPGEFDGIDVTAAYLFAAQEDINGTTNAGDGLPPRVLQKYFTTCVGDTCASPWPDNGMSEQARQQALAQAFAGLVRMFTGAVPGLFAVEQSLVYLTLAVSAAILITALLVTLMFAFFRPLESLPIGILQSYVRLFVLTYLVTLLLDILMGFLVYWAGLNNWVVFLGAGFLVAVLTIQLVFLGFGTIRQALTVALGGHNPTPGMGALLAAGGAAIAVSRGLGSGGNAGGPAEAPGGADIPDSRSLPAPPPAGGGVPVGALAAGELERSSRSTERLAMPLSATQAPTERLAAPPPGVVGGSGPASSSPHPAHPGTDGAATWDALDPIQQSINDFLAAQGIPPIQSQPHMNGESQEPPGAAGVLTTQSAPVPDAGPTAAPATAPEALAGMPSPTPTSPRLAAALAFAGRGWSVFPLAPRSKIPGKGSHGFKDATTDPAGIGRWDSGSNVGIATGSASRLLVIDVDNHADADGRPFVQAHPELFPLTPTVNTPTGGRHLYYGLPPGVGVPSTAGRIAPGVDSRGEGGYIVAPPSVHPNGGEYAWAPGAGPDDLPLTEAPPELLALLQPAEPEASPRRAAGAGPTPVIAATDPAPPLPAALPDRPAPEVLLRWGLGQAQVGQRNKTGFNLARQVLANGYTGEAGAAIMVHYADGVPQNPTDPYTRADALRSYDSAQHYPILDPWGPAATTAVGAAGAEGGTP